MTTDNFIRLVYNDGMVKITQAGQLIALIIKASQQSKLNGFVTNPQNPLQLGCLQFPKNHCVSPHQHRSISKTTHQNQEFIYVVTGRVKVEFFDKNAVIATHTLEKGDCLLQLAGGHGLTFLKPTSIVTIKQGPYSNRQQEKIEIKTFCEREDDRNGCLCRHEDDY